MSVMRHATVEAHHGGRKGGTILGAAQAADGLADCREILQKRPGEVVSKCKGNASDVDEGQVDLIAMEDARMREICGSVARAGIRRAKQAVPLAARRLSAEMRLDVPGL